MQEISFFEGTFEESISDLYTLSGNNRYMVLHAGRTDQIRLEIGRKSIDGYCNIADLAGFLFLGFGLLDGYRKGLVKKGASLLFIRRLPFFLCVSDLSLCGEFFAPDPAVISESGQHQCR